MSKKQKRMLFRVLASAVLFAVALLLPTEGWLRLFTFLIPYAVIAWDVLWRPCATSPTARSLMKTF